MYAVEAMCFWLARPDVCMQKLHVQSLTLARQVIGERDWRSDALIQSDIYSGTPVQFWFEMNVLPPDLLNWLILHLQLYSLNNKLPPEQRFDHTLFLIH